MSDISRRAKAFIEDDFVKDEFKKLEHLQYDIISNSGGYDYEERESAYRMLKAIQLVESHFKSLAMTDEVKKKKFKIL